ncbi:MAG: hypothetical protein MUC95_09425 [Spirochaetes bacterium]|nr:hypothetical protein [Spirochaetota bacterium]
MKGEILLQNVVNLVIIAVILEAAIMAIFTIDALKEIQPTRAVEASRDLLVILLSLFVCYQVEALRIFKGTGIKLPMVADTIISALVLARITNFIRQLTARFKQE